jgi:hypothetical protein
MAIAEPSLLPPPQLDKAQESIIYHAKYLELGEWEMEQQLESVPMERSQLLHFQHPCGRHSAFPVRLWPLRCHNHFLHTPT